LEGHFSDGELTPRNLGEVEAEEVALLCCEALNLEGAPLTFSVQPDLASTLNVNFTPSHTLEDVRRHVFSLLLP